MRMIGRTREQKAAEVVIIEVMRIAKLSNPRSILNIGEEDLDYTINNIAKDYLMDDFEAGKKILDLAVLQFFALSQRDSDINIGDFLRLSHAESRQAKEFKYTQQIINPIRNLSKKEEAKENFKRVKEALKTITEKPLPYNKDFRVQHDAYENYEMPENLKEPIQKMTMWERWKLELPEKLKEISNSELQSLCLKAWDSGLTVDEKNRFSELKQQEYLKQNKWRKSE